MKRYALVTVLIVLAASVLWQCGPGKSQVPLIPMEDFFRNPKKTSYQLSPDGEHLAFLQPWENRMNVHIRKIGEEGVTRITEATERDIRAYFWANNNRIAYVLDKGGDENFRLYAVDIDGSNLKDLTPFDEVRVGIIDDLEEIEDEMIIQMNKRDKRIFDAYRININTGEMKMVGENPGNITGWMTDHDGKIRIAQATDGVNISLLYRDNENQKFNTVKTLNFKESLSPMLFTFDNEKIYALSNLNRDKKAVILYDIKNDEEEEVIFEHPEVDVMNLSYSKKRKVLTAIRYYTDKNYYHFLDENRKQLQEELEKKLPGYEVRVASMSKDETKVLVRTFSDKSMGAYYFYNRETADFRKLVDVSPWLNEEHLADMKPVEYTARDGLTIHGYLTLPKGKEAENLPVVINPHGGPWARDYWGFNPEVQFMANRGYAVLQMNFRGSTGYGREFWEISFKEWGKSMQDDITDGVNWLIEQGIADPERVGIYGGSYGGYAVLAGLAFTPELYACGIDYVGVSNIFTLLESIPPYWEPMRDMLYEQVGHPEEDREYLEAVSPYFHADKIEDPLLIAQGANDPRVKKEQSDIIVEALKERGIDVEYIVKDNEGHGFGNEENRFDFYRAMETFLAKHLGGRAEQAQN